jgi:hypothetical protein
MVYRIQPAKAPFNPNMAVAQTAMQDTASFHAFLAIIASHREASQGLSLQLETTYHKVECIQIIRNRLNKREKLSDGTIYAVIWLWALEV